MKCEVIRNDLEVSLPDITPEHLEHVEFRMLRRNWRDVKVPFWKVGTVLEHRQAHYLVGLGYAKPADDECAAASVRWTENWDAVVQAREELANGIHPEDRQAFRAGWMKGYRKTDEPGMKDSLGNTSNIWEPGEKWDEYQAMLIAAESDDEDEDE